MNIVHMSWPYFVEGTVVHGYGRGSKELGCPTANLDENTVASVNIPTGVYWGLAQLNNNDDDENNCHVDKLIRPMICSMGYNPHYGNEHKSLEVHILHEFGYDFYDYGIKIVICGRIRDEKSFDSLQALIDEIESDKKFAQNSLQSMDMEKISQTSTLEDVFKQLSNQQ